MREDQPVILESTSEAETLRIAAALGRSLAAPALITLSGPLGAGKTQFVRGLAAGLGMDPTIVSSPTFVLSQEYVGPEMTLVHIDAYRMSSIDDLETIGWEELIRGEQLIIAMEWPERIADALPAERIEVIIEPLSQHDRRITIQAGNTPEGMPSTAAHLNDKDLAACRTCGREISPDEQHAPFCSDKCRMADLGRWFSGSYTISREIEEDDLW